jgi:hypothetical protein
MTLDAAKAAVIDARATVADLDRQYQAALADFHEHYQPLIVLRLACRAALEGAEAALREAALQHYAATQDKHPIAGVTIKEMSRIHYDPEEALRWALEHRMCLQLNTKLFETIARPSMHPFVEWRTEPQAQLAKNLPEELPHATA